MVNEYQNLWISNLYAENKASVLLFTNTVQSIAYVSAKNAEACAEFSMLRGSVAKPAPLIPRLKDIYEKSVCLKGLSTRFQS